MPSQKHPFQADSNSHTSAKLLYVTASKDEEDWPSFQHSHHFTELFYVRSGSGSFLLDDSSFPIAKDDLIIINPHIFHTEVSDQRDRLNYIALGIDGLSFSFPNGKDYHVFNCVREKNNLLFYFMSMLTELETRRDGYQEICNAMLAILTVQLSRITGSDQALLSTEDTNHDLFRIRRYIDSHYQDNISLDFLAGMSHINKYYLVHTFSQAYGLSPISYLNERRIQVSKDLLETTDHSISEIARLSGFSSQCYFAQSFKKSCGITAREYRKTVRSTRGNALSAL